MDGLTAWLFISTLMATGEDVVCAMCSPWLTLVSVASGDMFLIVTVVSPEVMAIWVPVLDTGPLMGATILAFCGV